MNIFLFATEMIFTVKIKNLKDLEKLSKILVLFLQPNFYLTLEGELGAGKTTLTQLIAKNLGIKEKITSPSFTILQRYQIKNNYYLNHFDFFYLKNVNINDNLLAFQEFAVGNINIIEWPKKMPQLWKKEKHINLKIVKQSYRTRLITILISYFDYS
ncbi:tRNA (adenosine(37)-N6)-threonylcarbamoyltransferase complex ATPase subunit type 1 TsaE [endosymbiont GvMRE of Glomus versiforme]|uniref:tRNA (adenosine(37)-N6)-threonylcarbamoyltransferase complex ATPase subunit type 1 TsaE n=1 Tax=endosymbiont GvMRE of Glomus versiforme TaxID=2039283 RepID=UPI000EB823F8|nr:tRNA (adenosine(37)-N6)-threonylcarbamoyltransferase complex ATPase subunit type 1 TsaE [endosymbiont GvMRE of Glomus versiforme]RHZ35239.1 tRNA threonylcarbamoyladenosine biosynthesis protein TsaE [endosymbiont GvMRE of Glomus versiforme]